MSIMKKLPRKVSARLSVHEASWSHTKTNPSAGHRDTTAGKRIGLRAVDTI